MYRKGWSYRISIVIDGKRNEITYFGSKADALALFNQPGREWARIVCLRGTTVQWAKLYDPRIGASA